MHCMIRAGMVLKRAELLAAKIEFRIEIAQYVQRHQSVKTSKRFDRQKVRVVLLQIADPLSSDQSIMTRAL
jgi:hypothetical protein